MRRPDLVVAQLKATVCKLQRGGSYLVRVPSLGVSACLMPTAKDLRGAEDDLCQKQQDDDCADDP
jgi:hypothetical protein